MIKWSIIGYKNSVNKSKYLIIMSLGVITEAWTESHTRLPPSAGGTAGGT